MTIDQFIEKLRHTPRDWYLIPEHQVLAGGIRRSEAGACYQCPLLAVLYPGEEAIRLPLIYGAKLGLSPEDSKQIQNAADMFPRDAYDPQLRQRLLEACGLADIHHDDNHRDAGPA